MDRKLELRTSSLRFNRVALDKQSRAIVFSWKAETEVSNIILLRLVILKWDFPPVKCITAFTEAK